MVRGLVLALLFFAGCAETDEDKATKVAKQCESVRDHIVALRLANATNVDRVAHGAVLREALGSDFISTCARTMPTEQRDCVLDSRDLATATACAKN